MRMTFEHDKDCNCECCYSGKQIQLALIKTYDNKFNLISAYESEAKYGDKKLKFIKDEIEEIKRMESKTEVETYYGGIFYVPERYDYTNDKVVEKVKTTEDYVYLYFDENKCRYVLIKKVNCFPEEIIDVEPKSTIKIIPAIIKVLLPKKAKELLKEREYLITSLRAMYKIEKKNKKGYYETPDVPAGITFDCREYALVITNKQINSLTGIDFDTFKKVEYYDFDREKLRKINYFR